LAPCRLPGAARPAGRRRSPWGCRFRIAVGGAEERLPLQDARRSSP
jgi:hypothetical protein